MKVHALTQLHKPNKYDVPVHLARTAVHGTPVPSYKQALIAKPEQFDTPVAASAPEIVAIGEALFDLISDQKGLCREDVQSWTPYAGGAPCNVATALAKLGAKVCFISALGKDERGKQLRDLMEERGVDVSGIQLRDEPTRDVYVTRDATGNREFAGFGLPTDKYSDCFIDVAKVPLKAVQSAQLLVTGTLGLAYPETRKCMETAVRLAKAQRRLVMIDINWRPVFWKDLHEAKRVITKYLDTADIVKISDDDLVWLYPEISVGAALKNPGVVAAKLPKATGVLVTAGDKGAAYHFRTPAGPLSGFVPVFKISVADTTGAGDAFTAGFLLQLLRQGGLRSLQAHPAKMEFAVRFGAACGALVCTKPGAIAGQPEERDVMGLIATH